MCQVSDTPFVSLVYCGWKYYSLIYCERKTLLDSCWFCWCSETKRVPTNRCKVLGGIRVLRFFLFSAALSHAVDWLKESVSSLAQLQPTVTFCFSSFLPSPSRAGKHPGLFSSPNFPLNFTMQKENSHHIKMPAHAWSTKCRWNQKLIV
jgi:hypothetical protein